MVWVWDYRDVGWGNDVHMAIVSCFLPANGGSRFLLRDRFSCIPMLFRSREKWFIGIERQVCPEGKLSSEIGADLASKVKVITQVVNGVNDVEALEV